MRLLEMILIVLLALDIVALLVPRARRGRWHSVLVAVTLVTLAAHLVVEGHRWQMLPVYGLTAVVALIAVLRRRGVHHPIAYQRKWGIRVAFVGTCVLILAGSTAVATLLPVPELPRPSGPYDIGTVTYSFVDSSRDEFYTADPHDKRAFMAQVWYPASKDHGDTPEPWIEHADLFGPAIAHSFGLPGFLFDHIGLIQSHAYRNAPIADGGPFPVILYSHGWTGFREVNTDQVENLVSHGYVVICPDHTYGALVTVFPDGRVVPYKPSAIPDIDKVGEAKYNAAVQRLVDAFVGDLAFLLDQTERWNSGEDPSPFKGELDLNRIGVFGHSTGGGATAEICAMDPRIKAALGMDIWAVPVSDDLLDKPKRLPFMMMDSEVWSSDKNTARQKRFWDSLKGPAYRMRIAGTRHNDFTLMPLASPLAPAMGLKGPLQGTRVVQIVNTYLLDFFDEYLQGKTEPLLEGPSKDFPEVRFTSRQGAPAPRPRHGAD